MKENGVRRTDDKTRFYSRAGSQTKHVGHRAGDEGARRSTVRTITAGELLACVNGTEGDCRGVRGHVRVPPFIHFVSVDLEGAELSVLRTWPWSTVEVGVFIVEQTADSSRPGDTRRQVRRLLRDHGYLKAPVENPGVDEYYVKPRFWEAKLAQKEWRVHPPGSKGC